MRTIITAVASRSTIGGRCAGIGGCACSGGPGWPLMSSTVLNLRTQRATPHPRIHPTYPRPLRKALCTIRFAPAVAENEEFPLWRLACL